MIIDCISDLHGCKPALQGGDLLIVAGDLTARDTEKQYEEFSSWLNTLAYRKVIIIAGNHDNYLMDCSKVGVKPLFYDPPYVEYLCDSGTELRDWPPLKPGMEDGTKLEVKDYKIWGTPWSLWFHGVNPKCKAFMGSENDLKKKFALIPDDIDILITHSPPHGILDLCESGHVGSKTLRRIMGRVKPKLWVCGHIHEGYGEFKDTTISGIDYHIVNASIMNEHYEPVNKPVRIVL